MCFFAWPWRTWPWLQPWWTLRWEGLMRYRGNEARTPSSSLGFTWLHSNQSYANVVHRVSSSMTFGSGRTSHASRSNFWQKKMIDTIDMQSYGFSSCSLHLAGSKFLTSHRIESLMPGLMPRERQWARRALFAGRFGWALLGQLGWQIWFISI